MVGYTIFTLEIIRLNTMDERFWVKNYPAGVPANIDIHQYDTVTEFLSSNFKKFSSNIAYHCMGKDLTYGEVDRLSDQFAAYLQSRGLEQGDRFAIMLPNILQFPIAATAALKAGFILVNTNPLYTPREMEHQLTDSGVKGILIADNFAHNLEKIIAKTDIKVVITTGIGDMLGGLKGKLVNLVVKHVKKMVPKFHLPNAVTFKKSLSEGKNFTLKPHKGDRQDVIVHQYTGGTTGVAKGAMLTNENIVTNAIQVISWMKDLEHGKETIITPLPLYHIFSFTVNYISITMIGAKNVLVTNPRDLPKFLGEFKKHKITMLTSINTLFNAMMNHKDFGTVDFSSLKVAVGGGMAIQKAVALRWKKLTGVSISEGYGLTETSPLACVNPVSHAAQLGTVGLPVPNTFLRIVDENRNVLPLEEVGEIQIKGPQVMKGYYNRPDETAKVLKDGWLSTGDMGLQQEDGFVRLVDRKKDMILVSGFNVYPNEVEDVIVENEKVNEVCVIGVPSEKSGEVVKAFIVRKDNSLTEKEVLDYCKESLTGYKRPKHVEFIDELPKSNVGKILRKVVRDKELAKYNN